MEKADIEQLILQAIQQFNLAREPGMKLEETADSKLFGQGSPLDSIGLVGLILDIEDHLRSAGHEVMLSDERAMSRSRSPFRDIPSLVDHVHRLVGE